MDKSILHQYNDICEEIHDTKRRIRDIEERLEKLERSSSRVKGGYGGKQSYHIDGVIDKKHDKTYLLAKRLRLRTFEAKLEDTKNEIEHYIMTLENSHMRRILTYRYLDGLTWDDVAREMGDGYTADAVRIEHQRFLKRC